jgi:glycosyltransferase involved in cell wall biosynthesis
VKRKVRVVYIISFIEKALIYEWLAVHFRESQKFDVRYILLNPSETELYRYLRELGCSVDLVRYRGKWDTARAVTAIYRLLRRDRPDIINTNLFDASFSGQLAGWLARVPVRIHSRHYSSQHLVYFRNALKYDRLINRLCTHIQVASGMVKDLMVDQEKVPANKIKVIHYGFQVDAFRQVDAARVEALSEKYFNGKRPFPVIGVISRFLHLKGIQYIVPAFSMLRKRFPDAHLVMANAKGPYAKEVNSLLNGLPDGSYTTIAFEKDIAALYRLFDVFVHVPIDPWCEAFGQIYIESLASGVPSVFTMSGIAHDVIRNEHHALVVDYKQAAPVYDAMIRILTDKPLAQRLAEQGLEVIDHFKFSRMARETDDWLESIAHVQSNINS